MRISKDYVIKGHLDGPLDVPDCDLWTFIKSALLRNPDATAVVSKITYIMLERVDRKMSSELPK